MRIDVHIHHDGADGALDRKLDQILVKLGLIQAQEGKMAATIQNILDGVNQESTVDDSIITLLNNIAAQLAAGGVPQAQIDAVMSVIQANQAKVTAAVVANTPAAPPPAP
jgi:hypothetical protein